MYPAHAPQFDDTYEAATERETWAEENIHPIWDAADAAGKLRLLVQTFGEQWVIDELNTWAFDKWEAKHIERAFK